MTCGLRRDQRSFFNTDESSANPQAPQPFRSSWLCKILAITSYFRLFVCNVLLFTRSSHSWKRGEANKLNKAFPTAPKKKVEHRIQGLTWTSHFWTKNEHRSITTNMAHLKNHTPACMGVCHPLKDHYPDNQSQKARSYFLRVIPTNWHSTCIYSKSYSYTLSGILSGILSDIYSGILSGILLDTYFGIRPGILSGKYLGILAFHLAFYLTFYPAFFLGFQPTYIIISIWRSVWHLIWQSTRPSFWHVYSHSIWHIFPHSIWHFILHIFDVLSAIQSDTYSDSLSGILPDTYSDILSGILSGLLFDSSYISPGILRYTYSDILSGILPDILFDIPSSILSDMLFGIMAFFLASILTSYLTCYLRLI